MQRGLRSEMFIGVFWFVLVFLFLCAFLFFQWGMWELEPIETAVSERLLRE